MTGRRFSAVFTPSTVTAPAGTIVLSADSLTSLNASSLLLGGVRTENADGTTTLDITASNIEIANDAGHPLTAPEILLAADGAGAKIAIDDGAAIAATLGASFGPLPPMRISSIGYGAGDRDFPQHANVLRAMVGDYDARLGMRPKNWTASLDDKWFFSPTYVRSLALELGFADFELRSLYDQHPNIIEAVVISGIELGGHDRAEIPPRALALLHELDSSIPESVKRRAYPEGVIRLMKNTLLDN